MAAAAWAFAPATASAQSGGTPVGSLGGLIEITSGLGEGEQVVTVGQIGLKNESKVTIINQPEADNLASVSADEDRRIVEILYDRRLSRRMTLAVARPIIRQIIAENGW